MEVPMIAEATRHEMAVMDETGDTKLIWDVDNEDEVSNAKRTFNDLKKKGYVAFKVNKKGDRGSVMDEFDADAEKIIMAPQMQGG
jgi:hypothetical protein